MSEQTQTTQIPVENNEEIEKMLDSVPWSDVPVTNTLPEQLYNWEVIETFGSRWNDSDKGEGKVYVGVTLQVTEPEDFRGRMHTENFTVGTEADPTASRIETWLTGGAFGAINLKKLLEFCEASNWRALKNKRFAAFTRNQKVAEREYTNLQINQLYRVGEVLPGTPTTVTGRRNRRTTVSQAANGTIPASTPAPCPICSVEFAADVIIEHVKTCTGLATP